MTVKDFVTSWKDVIQVSAISVALILSLFNFFQANYVRDELQATAIGSVDVRGPASEQDVLSLWMAVVNAGTRQAAVLQAEIVALRQEAGGYDWVRVWPPLGQGFEAKTVKPGDVS